MVSLLFNLCNKYRVLKLQPLKSVLLFSRFLFIFFLFCFVFCSYEFKKDSEFGNKTLAFCEINTKTN